MRTGLLSFVAAAALALAAAPAFAAPISTPSTLSINGESTAVYVFNDAADHDILNETGPVTTNGIFDNTVNIAGNTASLGSQNGTLTFSLSNVTTGTTLLSDQVASDGYYHILSSTSADTSTASLNAAFAVFNEGNLSAAALASIQAITGNPSITFVGWEDQIVDSDYDYNDLIFAFSNVTSAPPPAVPEPATLALLGAGLVGFGAMRRRKKSA